MIIYLTCVSAFQFLKTVINSGFITIFQLRCVHENKNWRMSKLCQLNFKTEEQLITNTFTRFMHIWGLIHTALELRCVGVYTCQVGTCVIEIYIRAYVRIYMYNEEERNRPWKLHLNFSCFFIHKYWFTTIILFPRLCGCHFFSRYPESFSTSIGLSGWCEFLWYVLEEVVSKFIWCFGCSVVDNSWTSTLRSMPLELVLSKYVCR